MAVNRKLSIRIDKYLFPLPKLNISQIDRGHIMKLRITHGTLSRKHGVDGKDAGFMVLFAGEYPGSICDSGELEIKISEEHCAYLSLRKVEEKILQGELVVIEA